MKREHNSWETKAESNSKKRLEIQESEQLHSCMNNTRWRELFEKLNTEYLPMRVKALGAKTPTDWREVSYGHIPLTYIEIFGHYFPYALRKDEIEIPNSGGQIFSLTVNGPLAFS